MRIVNWGRVKYFFFWTLFISDAAFAQTVVWGTVVGADRQPMKAAQVSLLLPNESKPLKTIQAAGDGRYSLPVDSTGLWFLRFSGVGHRDRRVLLLAQPAESLHVDVRLGGPRFVSDFSHVSVVGSFNRWYPPSTVPMRLQPDSTYLAEVASPGDSLAYSLSGVKVGEPFEGTLADRYIFDPTRGYVSRIRAHAGNVTITFDPKLLVRPEGWGDVNFVDAPEIVSRFARYNDELQRVQSSYFQALQDSARMGHFRPTISFDWSTPILSVGEELRKESAKVLREELYFNYLTLTGSAKKYEVAMLDSALRTIEPGSIVWSLNPHLIYEVLARSDLPEEQRTHYIKQVIELNPGTATKVALLFDEFMVERLSGRTEEANNYFELLESRYPFTREAAMLKANYSPAPALSVGKPIPNFSLRFLGDTARLVTRASLRGNFFIIDFWAAKSKECVAQRKFLDAAYRKYRYRHFTILSISLDDSLKDVTEFRRGKWKMPWINSFLGKNAGNEVVQAFQAFTVPKTFLVDSTGTLLEQGDQLISASLAGTLAKYIKQ